MVRYDCDLEDYPTKWICRDCMTFILSEAGVANHLASCSGQPRQSGHAPPIPTKK